MSSMLYSITYYYYTNPGGDVHMDPMKNMISEPEEKIYSIGKMVAVM